MRTDDFDYALPPERIAQTPLDRRDASRLLVVDRGRDRLHHSRVADLGEWLRPGDRLVFNDTRVVPCRLLGRREGHTGVVELFLLNPVAEAAAGRFSALARPARKLAPGTRVLIGESEIAATVIGAPDSNQRIVTFPGGVDVLDLLRRHGHVPLPPYIQREDRPEDRERYQTMFADREGAVAAPTAGLHFTPELLASLEQGGVNHSRITLHVGLGTFAPVTAEDPRNHRMEAEFYTISPAAAAEIGATRTAGGRIVAVGTTVVRTLETAGADSGTLTSGDGWTRAFIYPPYRFRAVDALLTNFHLPRSTLLMLVSAFGGTERVREAYRTAVEAGYRFYSYGDAMLLV